MMGRITVDDWTKYAAALTAADDSRRRERDLRQKVGHYQLAIGEAVRHLDRLDVPADQRRHLDEAVRILTAARNGRLAWMADDGRTPAAPAYPATAEFHQSVKASLRVVK